MNGYQNRQPCLPEKEFMEAFERHKIKAFDQFVRERCPAAMEMVPEYAPYAQWCREEGVDALADTGSSFYRERQRVLNIHAQNAAKKYLMDNRLWDFVLSGKFFVEVDRFASRIHPDYSAFCSRNRFVAYPLAFLPRILKFFNYPFNVVNGGTCSHCSGNRRMAGATCPTCSGRGRVQGGGRVVRDEVIPEVNGGTLYVRQFESAPYCPTCCGRGHLLGDCPHCGGRGIQQVKVAAPAPMCEFPFLREKGHC